MKRVAFIVTAILALLVPAALAAQVLASDDNLNPSTLDQNWNRAAGEWRVRGGMLFQGDVDQRLARADRAVPQSGSVEISFRVRYEAGGLADSRFGQYHAGFGIHLGVDRAPAQVAWGAPDSYLLWLNLDTRSGIPSEHEGFRGQVYRSTTNSQMDLTDLNVDIIGALNDAGISFTLPALSGFLEDVVPIRIRVNYDTGRIMVNDPTNPSIWFWFDVDPAVLDGSYLSLRTNSLAISFRDFTVTRM